MKISVIGCGRVGSTIAFALVSKGVPEQLILVGRTSTSALGDAHDLRHASCFSRPAMVRSGVIADTADSDIVIFTASAKLADEESKPYNRRLEAPANAQLIKDLIPPLAEASPAAVFVIITNPVDALTQLAQELSGLPLGRVMGAGTLIDTVRFRAFLAQRCNVHPLDIRAYILGEHGESQVAALSAASVGGAPLDVSAHELRELAIAAREAGIRVKQEKGYTNHAIAMATMLIVDAIATDARAVLPVSTRLNRYCGVSDVCLSVPCVVGRAGVIRTLDVSLAPEEIREFQASAKAVAEMYANLKDTAPRQ